VDDFEGTESVEAPEIGAQTSGPEGDGGQPSEGTGTNPSWEPIRSALGPSFQLVEPHLREFDKQAEKRISSLNSQLKEYSSLGSPEEIRSYATLAQRLDTEPEVIYQALGQFLQQNGRLPQTEGEMQEAVDDVEDDDYTDPRLAELEAQQEQMRQFLEAQEQERIEKEADASLDQELSALRQAHPDFSDDDIREILQRAAFLGMNGQDPNLENVAQEYIEKVVNRIRNVQRPGDSAPRLIPTAGGVPTGAPPQSLGQLPKGSVQDLVASYLTQGR
jgi:hypothetical protein